MNSGKILIFGRGYLAERMSTYFGDRAEMSPADITDAAAVAAALDEAKPEVIINAAAKTRTAEIEKSENQAEAYRVNVHGPAVLAHASRSRGIRMVHLSTAMMFDGAGSDGQGITEDDVPNPTSYYAWTKAWADAQLSAFADRDGILIVRLHTPLSKYANPRNLLTKLQGFSSVVDTPGSLTVVEDLLSALDQLIEKKLTGVYNVVNPGSISMYEIVEMMKKYGLINEDKHVERLTRQQLDEQVAANGGARQTFPILSTAKLQNAGIALREVHEAVEASIKEYTS